MPPPAAAPPEPAPAKVNLTLRVIGRRADGYHDIESLVAFAGVGDTLTLLPGDTLELAVHGPTAAAAGELADNLVLKAACALAAGATGIRLGRFELGKHLPVAAGLGGGSADAAAALRLLARANGLSAGDPRVRDAAKSTGADVPVCLDPRPRIMRGIGDVLSGPLALPRLPAVLVNPGVAVPTRDVFALLGRKSGEVAEPARDPVCRDAAVEHAARQGLATLIELLANSGNDLQAPATRLQPVIAQVLAQLQNLSGCRLARMSGSGATCFGLFDSNDAADAAAGVLRHRHSEWWIWATALG